MTGPTEAWRQERQTYLGGTDISAIMDLNPWRGPLETYLAKTQGEAAVQTQDPRKAWIMQTGHYLEPVVAQMYADRMGIAIDSLTSGGLVRDARRPYFAANPDRLIYGMDRGLEIKTAGEGELHSPEQKWGEEGTDEVPDPYLIQCQWYMGILGLPRWDLAAFFLGSSREFRIYQINFNADLFASMTQAADLFWNGHVVPRIAPTEARNLEVMAAYLASRAARHKETVEPPAEAIAAAMLLKAIQKEQKRLEIDEAAAKAQLSRLLDAAGAKKFKGHGWSSGIVTSNPDAPAKKVTDWEPLARELALVQGMPVEVLNQHITKYTTDAPKKAPYLLIRFSKEEE